MFYLDIWNLIISQLDVVSVFRLATTCKILHKRIWSSYDFCVNDYYIWRCAVANRCLGTLSKLLSLTQYQWPTSDGLIYAMLFDDSETFDLLLEVTPVRDIHLSLAIGLNDTALLEVLLDSCGEDHPLGVEHILHAEKAIGNGRPGIVDIVAIIQDSRCYRSLKYKRPVSGLTYLDKFPCFPEVSLVEMGPVTLFHELRARNSIRLPYPLAACQGFSPTLEDADTLLGYLRWFRCGRASQLYCRYEPLSEEEGEFLRLLSELYSDILLKWNYLSEEEYNPRAYVECGFDEEGIYDHRLRKMHNDITNGEITPAPWVYYDRRRDANSPLEPLPEDWGDWEDEENELSQEISAGRLCEWKENNDDWTNALQSQRLEYWEAVACDVARCYSVLARN